MYPLDKGKTMFITPMANYCYKVMPFGLKNARATYQRLMNKVFSKHIGNLMEVYIYDMLVKTKEKDSLLSDLEVVFNYLRWHNMRLNLQKCAFTIEARKFPGFMLTHQGIEANLDKCRAILEMKRPTSVKEVQRLLRRIASFSRFTVASAQKAFPLFLSLEERKYLQVDAGV